MIGSWVGLRQSLAAAALLARLNALSSVDFVAPVTVLDGTNFSIRNTADHTKQVQLDCSGITASTVRTLTVPNASGTLPLLSLAQTWSAAQTFAGINATSIGATTRGTISGTTGDFNSTLAVTGVTTLTGAPVANSATASTTVLTGGATFAGGIGVAGQVNATNVCSRMNGAAFWTGTAFSGSNGPAASDTTGCAFSRSVNNNAGGFDSGVAFYQATSTSVVKPSAILGVVGTSSWTNATVSTQTSDFYFLTRDNADGMIERGRIKSTGQWQFAAAPTVTTVSITGSANQYCTVMNGNSTSGQSYGMSINAGTTSADQCAIFSSQGGSAYLTVRGDGTTIVNGTLRITAGAFPGNNIASLYKDAAQGLVITGFNGSAYCLTIANNAGGNLLTSITGSADICVGPGSVSTSANTGFCQITSCAGAPTGTPVAVLTNAVSLVYDRTNHKLYAYDGAWKSIQLI